MSEKEMQALVSKLDWVQGPEYQFFICSADVLPTGAQNDLIQVVQRANEHDLYFILDGYKYWIIRNPKGSEIAVKRALKIHARTFYNSIPNHGDKTLGL